MGNGGRRLANAFNDIALVDGDIVALAFADKNLTGPPDLDSTVLKHHLSSHSQFAGHESQIHSPDASGPASRPRVAPQIARGKSPTGSLKESQRCRALDAE